MLSSEQKRMSLKPKATQFLQASTVVRWDTQFYFYTWPLSSVSHPLGFHLPTQPPKAALKLSPKSMPFEVMWHDIEIQAFLVQKVWLLHRVFFFSPVVIEKCFNLQKTLERFNLYVTADLVTVCIDSAVQTQAEKEKQSKKKPWRKAASRYSSTSVLLKQRNCFCAFMYLFTIRGNSNFSIYTTAFLFCITSAQPAVLQLHPSAKLPRGHTQTPSLQSVLYRAQDHCCWPHPHKCQSSL